MEVVWCAGCLGEEVLFELGDDAFVVALGCYEVLYFTTGGHGGIDGCLQMSSIDVLKLGLVWC